MKAIFSIFLLFSLFFLNSVSSDFSGKAIKTSEGLKIEWDKVQGVLLYRIDYGYSSGNYTNSIDLIENNNYTIKNLDLDKNYYFLVNGYDNSGKDLYKSSEIIYTPSIDNSLYILDAELVDKNKIELTFSNKISTVEDSDFIVESLKNSNDYFNFIDVALNPDSSNKVILTLDGEPIVGSEYKVIVLSIVDEFNQNIQFGIDSETVFTANLNSVNEEDFLSLNSADENIMIPTNVGAELTSEDVNSNLLNVASDSDRLPQTGPAEILLLILALIFGGFIFLNRYRKA